MLRGHGAGEEPSKKSDKRDERDRKRGRHADAQFRNGWNVNNNRVYPRLRVAERLGEDDNQHNDRRQEKDAAENRRPDESSRGFH